MTRIEGPGTGSDVSAADLLTGVHCLARVFHDCFRRFLQDASFDFEGYFVSAVDSLVDGGGAGDAAAAHSRFNRQKQCALLDPEDEASAGLANDVGGIFHSIAGLLCRVLDLVRDQAAPVSSIRPAPGAVLPAEVERQRLLAREQLLRSAGPSPTVCFEADELETPVKLSRPSTAVARQVRLACAKKLKYVSSATPPLTAIQQLTHGVPCPGKRSDPNPMTRSMPASARVAQLEPNPAITHRTAPGSPRHAASYSPLPACGGDIFPADTAAIFAAITHRTTPGSPRHAASHSLHPAGSDDVFPTDTAAIFAAITHRTTCDSRPLGASRPRTVPSLPDPCKRFAPSPHCLTLQPHTAHPRPRRRNTWSSAADLHSSSSARPPSRNTPKHPSNSDSKSPTPQPTSAEPAYPFKSTHPAAKQARKGSLHAGSPADTTLSTSPPLPSVGSLPSCPESVPFAEHVAMLKRARVACIEQSPSIDNDVNPPTHHQPRWVSRSAFVSSCDPAGLDLA